MNSPAGTTSRTEELCRTGKKFLDQHRFVDAEAAFIQAREQDPDNPEVYYCMGLLFSDLRRPADALVAFDRTIALKEDHARAHNNRGSSLQQLGKLQEAEAAYQRALELAPDEALPYINLANVIDQQLRTAESLKVYDLALSRNVAPELIGQYRSALLGKATARSPDSWVRATFDNFAPTFDEHMRSLQYAIPAALVEMFGHRLKAGDSVLDLGCGTGLVAAALAHTGARFVGVDLSERMLVQARDRGVYAELHTDEIHAYLERTPSASVDAVCASDVLIYIGNLTALFDHVYRVLKPGGLFAFSIEESNSDFSLQNSGRFAHSRAYIRTLTGFRFSSLDDRAGAIRLERGKPLHGRVYLMQT